LSADWNQQIACGKEKAEYFAERKKSDRAEQRPYVDHPDLLYDAHGLAK
jgi:hypothetical protein